METICLTVAAIGFCFGFALGRAVDAAASRKSKTTQVEQALDALNAACKEEPILVQKSAFVLWYEQKVELERQEQEAKKKRKLFATDLSEDIRYNTDFARIAYSFARHEYDAYDNYRVDPRRGYEAFQALRRAILRQEEAAVFSRRARYLRGMRED